MTEESASRATDDAAAAEAAAARAPGAIPPTEGVPPEDGTPAGAARSEPSAAEDLADGLDLMVRAARKALRSFDPRVEEAAQRALKQLQELDVSALGDFSKASRIDREKLEQAADQAGREIAGVVERVAERIDTLFRKKPPE